MHDARALDQHLDRLVVSALLREIGSADAVVEMCRAIGAELGGEAIVVLPSGIEGRTAIVGERCPAELVELAAQFAAEAEADLAAIEDTARTLGVTWIATEAIVGFDDGPLGLLVLFGHAAAAPSAEVETMREGGTRREEPPDEWVTQLARKLGLVLDRHAGETALGRLVHRLNNLLAGVIANIEYVVFSLDPNERTALSVHPPEERDELLRASSGALTSARRAVGFLRSVFRRSEPPP